MYLLNIIRSLCKVVALGCDIDIACQPATLGAIDPSQNQCQGSGVANATNVIFSNDVQATDVVKGVDALISDEEWIAG
jgi:hypothetical protein